MESAPIRGDQRRRCAAHSSAQALLATSKEPGRAEVRRVEADTGYEDEHLHRCKRAPDFLVSDGDRECEEVDERDRSNGISVAGEAVRQLEPKVRS